MRDTTYLKKKNQTQGITCNQSMKIVNKLKYIEMVLGC